MGARLTNFAPEEARAALKTPCRRLVNTAEADCQSAAGKQPLLSKLAEPSQLRASEARMPFVFNEGTPKVSTTF
jgi:hypothetical protein